MLCRMWRIGSISRGVSAGKGSRILELRKIECKQTSLSKSCRTMLLRRAHIVLKTMAAGRKSSFRLLKRVTIL